MKTKIIMAYLALFFAIISISEANAKGKPECCKKKKECCTKNEACCKEQRSKKDDCCLTQEECCAESKQCCETTSKADKTSLEHNGKKHHKNTCCQ